MTRSSFVDGIGRDRIVHLGLVLMTALSRIPFHSRILYHWDSVNFANGLRHFDVLAEHPQPPGYIVYVARQNDDGAGGRNEQRCLISTSQRSGCRRSTGWAAHVEPRWGWRHCSWRPARCLVHGRSPCPTRWTRC